MNRYANDQGMTNTARKFRAVAAVCVFGLVGAVWLQAELFADQMYDARDAVATTPGTPATTAPTPDAENPSATLAY